MRLIYAGLALFCALAFGDTITLRNGNVINGTYLGGTPRSVRVEVGDSIQTVDVSDISRIDFGAIAVTSAPAPRREGNVFRPQGRPEDPGPAAQAMPMGSV